MSLLVKLAGAKYVYDFLVKCANEKSEYTLVCREALNPAYQRLVLLLELCKNCERMFECRKCQLLEV